MRGPAKLANMRPSKDWQRRGLSSRKSITGDRGPPGLVPDPITDPLGWCEYTWAKQDKYKAPEWAGGPVEHQSHGPSTASHVYGLFMGPC